jgi:GntR family transcriptional regulator
VEGIARGELKPGDSLPSVRQLGVDLGINLHTVNKAYSALEAEGFVRIYGRRGAVISDLHLYDKPFLRELEESLSVLFLEAKGRGVGNELFETIVKKVLDQPAASAPENIPANKRGKP